jgi:hypothetical protein
MGSLPLHCITKKLLYSLGNLCKILKKFSTDHTGISSSILGSASNTAETHEAQGRWKKWQNCRKKML